MAFSGSKMPQMRVKNQNFKKSLCTPLDTPKRYLWSKFGVSRTFLAPKSALGVILRYCAIRVKNPFSHIFLTEIGSKKLF